VKKKRIFLLWIIKGDVTREREGGAASDAPRLTLEEGEVKYQYKCPLHPEPSHTQHFSASWR